MPDKDTITNHETVTLCLLDDIAGVTILDEALLLLSKAKDQHEILHLQQIGAIKIIDETHSRIRVQQAMISDVDIRVDANAEMELLSLQTDKIEWKEILGEVTYLMPKIEMAIERMRHRMGWPIKDEGRPDSLFKIRIKFVPCV